MHRQPIHHRLVAGMRDQTFLILLALAGGELHGFGIIGEVKALSDGTVLLGPGTLYGALDRLVDEQLVIATRTEVVAGRHRRYYELTTRGREALGHESARRESLVRVARRRLSSAPGIAPA